MFEPVRYQGALVKQTYWPACFQFEPGEALIIESDLPMSPERYVKAIHLVVDHNPDAHLAAFHLTPAIGSVSISTRIKMKRSTWVRALAQTSDGEIWGAYTKVAVTLNGCG